MCSHKKVIFNCTCSSFARATSTIALSNWNSVANGTNANSRENSSVWYTWDTYNKKCKLIHMETNLWQPSWSCLTGKTVPNFLWKSSNPSIWLFAYFTLHKMIVCWICQICCRFGCSLKCGNLINFNRMAKFVIHVFTNIVKSINLVFHPLYSSW